MMFPSDPKRLFALLPWFDIGGAEKFALDLFAQLASRGWKVSAVSTERSSHRRLDNFRCICDDLHTIDDRISQPQEFISDLIQSRRPDVVLISQSRLGFLLLPYLRLTCPGPVYVDYCHIEEAWGAGGFPRMAAGLDAFIDLHMVTSDHLKKWMIEQGADPARTEVCTVNIDPNLWKPDPEARSRIRASHNIADDEALIVFSGRLAPQKQPHVLAAALNALNRRGVRFRALVAGDGEERERLENYLRGNNLTGRVKVLGMLASEQIRELLAASDIFFLPSRWEGIALSIFEAMAMQVAVVGADVGGQSELVTPETGILVKPTNDADEIEHYAHQLACLINHPGERRAMAVRARERIVRHFTLEQMGARIDSLLREISSRARRFELQRDENAAGRFAACAMHTLSDDSPLDFWRVPLSDDFVQSDPTGFAAHVRAYFERATLDRLDTMPSWRIYQRVARWTVRGWDRLPLAERIRRFTTSLLRRVTDRRKHK